MAAMTGAWAGGPRARARAPGAVRVTAEAAAAAPMTKRRARKLFGSRRLQGVRQQVKDAGVAGRLETCAPKQVSAPPPTLSPPPSHRRTHPSLNPRGPGPASARSVPTGR